MLIRRLPPIAALLCMLAGIASAPAAADPLRDWQRDPELAGVLMPTAASLIDQAQQITEAATLPEFSPRAILTSMANRLRDIRYRRGGREPSTGFDCSGFVRYVFQHGLNVELPASSAAQFLTGLKVDRKELREGDLVFFRTEGKRISHVGIYLGDGSFIHAPSSGKRVSVSQLSEKYWAARFAGAKRPDVLAKTDDGDSDDRS